LQEGKKTLRRFAWVDGKKAPKGWNAYTGPNVVTLIDGRTVRFNKGGTYNVIGVPPGKVIETNAGLRNAAIGGFHGSVPFGKTITIDGTTKDCLRRIPDRDIYPEGIQTKCELGGKL